MAKKRQPTTTKDSIESAADTAFGNISELREELESWYDNLPEAFQSGDKGDRLQEAIGNLENCDAPSVPECLEDVEVEYTLHYKRKMSRSDRRDECIVMADAIVSACEEEIARLDDLTFNDDGQLLGDNNEVVGVTKDEDGEDVEPMTEDQRDDAKSEIESYKDEVDSAKSEWESAEFPGMYS
jgi:hypothetical protein